MYSQTNAIFGGLISGRDFVDFRAAEEATDSQRRASYRIGWASPENGEELVLPRGTLVASTSQELSTWLVNKGVTFNLTSLQVEVCRLKAAFSCRQLLLADVWQGYCRQNWRQNRNWSYLGGNCFTPHVKTPNQIKLTLLGMCLAVFVIPEGSVVVVTLTMAIGVRCMASKNAIGRKLPSVEMLRSVTVISSDKKHENPVQTIELLSSTTPTSAKAAATDAFTDVSAAPTHLTMVASCNNASVIKEEDGSWKLIGDPTEVAMVVAAQEAAFFHTTVGLQKLGEYAFDSERKLMSVFYLPPSDQSNSFKSETTLIMVKGPPEGVFSRCTSFFTAAASSVNACQLVNDRDGVREAVNDEFAACNSQRAGHMASSGLRVLALVTRDPDGGRAQAESILAESKSSAAEAELIFVGLISLIGPQSIKVVMITGDHIATASSLAKDLGIIHGENAPALKGFEVDLLCEEALADLKPFPAVFARVSPDNKLKIVRAMQTMGNIVAMTPAIKYSDAGIAMGISGTEITKKAADIVLADDNRGL
ncbi:P-type ATPase [Cladochytrium replicatum]|nr:P-type ATPase [Cladochytrium replicatum]